MSSALESSSCVEESRVIAAPIAKVWATVRGLDQLKSFWPAVQESVLESGLAADQVGSVQKVTFKDGTVQKFKVLEISDLEVKMSYEIIESNPPTVYMSAVHTIRVFPVTHDNTSFVSWKSEFSSSENTAAVVADARFKKKEALEGLSVFLKA